MQKPVAARQPLDCLLHSGRGHSPLCRGAVRKGFRSSLDLPSSYIQFYSKNRGYFEVVFYKVPILFKAYLN